MKSIMREEIRNKIDNLWDSFWSGGISNPLTVIEQISYLLFYKRLAEIDEENGNIIFNDNEDTEENNKKNFRWSLFKLLSQEEKIELFREKVFPYIKTLGVGEDSAFSKHMKDAVFQIKKASLFDEAIKMIDQLNTHDTDIMGDLYEQLLKKLHSAGMNGQFRTPRHIIKMMIQLIKPTIDDIICDPACGSSGFLMAASEFVLESNTSDEKVFIDEEGIKHRRAGNLLMPDQWEHFKNSMFFGNDFDTSMLRISAMNMILHGVSNPNIEYADSLSKDYNYEERFSLVFANPPFTGSIDVKNINANLKSIVDTKKTELLFLALFLRILKSNGRCAAIVPEGVLFNASSAHKKIRQLLIEDNCLQAIISMPSGVFKPYAGVSTAILVFQKGGVTEKVWVYEMESDGRTLDDKRDKIGDGKGDIPDIISSWQRCMNEKELTPHENDKWFWIKKSEFIHNSYSYNLSKYKKIDYPIVDYGDPSYSLEMVINLEKDILKEMSELKDLI